MRGLLTIAVFLLLFLDGFGQSSYLYISENELEEIIRSPENVNAKITELQDIAARTNSLTEKVTALQTIVLLEGHALHAECDLSSAYAQMAELTMQMNATKDALLLSHKTLSLAQKCEGINAIVIYNHIGRLGSFHMLANNLDSALFYFRLAETYSDTIAEPLWHASSLNNLGMVWTKLNKPDSAYSYFNQAIFGLNTSNEEHRHFLGNVNDNLAEWHQQKGNLTVAKQFYQENIELSHSFYDTVYVMHGMLGLSRILLEEGNFKQAHLMLDSVAYWLPLTHTTEAIKAKQMGRYYTLREELYTLEKKYELALKASKDALEWHMRGDSIAQIPSTLLIRALNGLAISRVNQEVELRNRIFELEQTSSKQLKIGSAIVALLLVLTVVFGLKSRRKR